MGFIFKSMFWLLLVAAFMPRDLEAHASAPAAEPAAAHAAVADAPVVDMGASMARFCEDRPEVCAAGSEAAAAARAAGRFAAERAAMSLADSAERE